MSIHSEVLALIEAGPRRTLYHDIAGNCIDCDIDESHDEFARRIALRAVELEREAMRDAFVDVLVETDATWSVGDARNVAEEAIRRRGKP